jgi:hypothetical protein
MNGSSIPGAHGDTEAAERLTDVALDARFCDQAHMNAEFRALGGLTPREFLALRHPVGDGSTASDRPAAA